MFGILLGWLTGRDDVVLGMTARPRFLGVDAMASRLAEPRPVLVSARPQDAFIEVFYRLADDQGRLTGLLAPAGVDGIFDTVVSVDRDDLVPAADIWVVSVDQRPDASGALALRVRQGGDRVRLHLDFRPDLLDRADVTRMLDVLTRLFTAVANDPAQPVGRVPLLGAEELALTVEEWNATGTPPAQATLCEVLRGPVTRTPDAPALVSHAETLSFRELDLRAARLARLFTRRGVGPGDRVALVLPRSVSFVVAVLAVARAGAAFVPVDHQRLWALLHQAVPAPDPSADERARAETSRRADDAAAELGEYFTDLVAAKRATPGDDLVSTCLAERAADPEPLTDEEIVQAVLPVFGAGVTTLSDTIGNIAHTLLASPEQHARLATDPGLAERAAAEALRHCGGYHVTRRYVTRDTEIGGVAVPAGGVVLLLASANRDPDVVPRPEEFDISRAAPSLAFGAGIHHCLGAALARLLVEALCASWHRVPALRAAGRPVWRPSGLFFGPVRLPVVTGSSKAGGRV